MANTTPKSAPEHDSAAAVPLHERPEFTAWLTASCQRQHVPVTITNPTVLANVAALLR
jgi:hypothetical protein